MRGGSFDRLQHASDADAYIELKKDVEMIFNAVDDHWSARLFLEDVTNALAQRFEIMGLQKLRAVLGREDRVDVYA